MQGIQCCTVQLNIIIYYSQCNPIQNDAMQYNTVHEDHALSNLSQYTPIQCHRALPAMQQLSCLIVCCKLYDTCIVTMSDYDYELQAIRHL